ncbi:MAG: hypothetical protein AAFY41_10105 [Bacteroidota bacterium]
MRSFSLYNGDGEVFSTGQNSYVIISDSDKDYKVKARVGGKKAKVVDAESEEARDIKEEVQSEMKEQIYSFMIDYADLIGQLKPSDRIAIQTKNRNERIFIGVGNPTSKPSGYSAHVLKKDLTAYKQGKLDRDDVIQKITFIANDENETSKDIELFATIFSRLYEADLSNTYYMAYKNMSYTQLDGFGTTFNLKMYSSNSNDGLHTITTTGEWGLSQEERDRKVEAMYPEFKRTFKENILDYGRTVRSLEPEEMLIFKVKLTECKGCKMPEEIEVVVKGKTLQAYDKGSLNRDAGLKQITIKEKRG